MPNSVYTDVRVRITIDIRDAARDQECSVASLGCPLGRQSNNRDIEVTALRPNRFTLGALSTVKERPSWGEHPSHRPPRLLDQLDTVCRRRHFSPRTSKAYRYWVRQYIFFHDKRHPVQMGPAEVAQFLNHLAVERRVAASTQSQALSAIVFLYETVLEKPLGQMSSLKRVQRRSRVPVVLTIDEVKAALAQRPALLA